MNGVLTFVSSFFAEKLTLPRRRTSRRMLASISIENKEITGSIEITGIVIRTTALSKERTSTLTRKTKEKMVSCRNFIVAVFGAQPIVGWSSKVRVLYTF